MPRRIEAACITGLLLAATPALAGDRQTVSIAPGTLGNAVIILGRQTGSSIGMSDQDLARVPVPGLGGRFSVNQALDTLLAGSGARAVRIAPGTWRIVRDRRVIRPSRAPAERRSDGDDAGESDIVVTASKRQVPLGRYAGTVEIVDAGGIRGQEAASGMAALLSRVASLSSTYLGTGRNKLFIRGIADSGFAGPTQATTGEYLGDMRLNYAAPDPDLRLYDIAAVEVLEGPQGTLYGAGSLGGIIRLVPNAPDLIAAGGQINAGASATQHGDPGGDLAATLNVPIVTDRLALRVVGYGSHEGGYIDDTLRERKDVNDVDVAGGRAALRFQPDDAWTIDLSGLYQRIRGNDAQYASRSVGTLDRQSPVRQNYLANYGLASIRVERRWDDVSFVSTTGLVHHDLSERYDATRADGPPELYHQRNHTRMFTTESRLSRDLHDGLGWLVGFSYLDNRASISRTLGPVDQPAPSTGVRNSISEWTGFAEASVQPLDALVLTAGGRVTSSHLFGVATDRVMTLPAFDVSRAEAQANRRETAVLPSISLLTDAIPGVALFLRYQQGFRPGGLAVDDYQVRRFRNDRVGTLEAGFRRGLPGYDPIALSASVAWTDWNNIQADLTDRQGLPTTANIGDGRIYTFEGRVALVPVRGLTIDLTAIYNDSLLAQPEAFVSQLSYAGRSLSLPNVAGFGSRVAVDYRTPLGAGDELHLSANARYVGRSRLGVGPIFGREQGNYVDTALAASWSRGPLRYSLSLTNLFDAAGNRFALGTPFDLNADDYTPMRPRTVRFGIDFAF